MSSSNGVHPLRDEVFVRRIPPEERTTPSGLVIPAVEQPQWHRALVLSVGRGRTSRSGTLQPSTVSVGDVVLLGAFVGVNIKIAEDPQGEYLVVSEREILATEDRVAAEVS